MTATVYNGVLQGTGATHIQTLYNNNTGKNVRIVWNYIEAGNSNPNEVEMIVGPITTLPGHSSGNNLDTILLSLTSGFVAGKNNRGASSSTGSFPTEMMLSNGDKISIRIPSQVGTHQNGLHYNFVAITED